MQGEDQASFEAQQYRQLVFRGRELLGRRGQRAHQPPPRLKSCFGGVSLAARRVHQRMTHRCGQQFHVVEAQARARLPHAVSSQPSFGDVQRLSGERKIGSSINGSLSSNPTAEWGNVKSKKGGAKNVMLSARHGKSRMCRACGSKFYDISALALPLAQHRSLPNIRAHGIGVATKKHPMTTAFHS